MPHEMSEEEAHRRLEQNRKADEALENDPVAWREWLQEMVELGVLRPDEIEENVHSDKKKEA